MTTFGDDQPVTDKQVRSFGVILLIGFGLIALAMYRKAAKAGEPAGALPVVLACLGAVVCLASLAAPRAMVPAYKAWMLLGHALGAVVSRVILVVVFYACLTPLSLLMRLTGRDRLCLRRDPAAETYWRDRPPHPSKAQYWRQF